MKRTFTAVYLLLFILCINEGFSQTQQQPPRDMRPRVRGYSSQQEIVNMDSTTRMDQALLALSEMSKKFAGKPIVDLEKRLTPIGIDIVNQQWRDALEMILERNLLWYREDPEFIVVMTADMARALEGAQAAVIKKPTLESREILITTTFVSLDLTKSTNMGIDWSLFYNKENDTAGGNMFGSLDKQAFNINYGRSFKGGGFTALLQFYSSHGVADVIASPRVSVTSGDTGMAQVGQDISVQRRDISAGGNVTVSTQQIQTGTIVHVRPEVIREDTVSFIWLDLEIERSFAITTGDLPIIDRNKTRTKLLLVDGEEAFLSGLYYNETMITRAGIPFLKDLPPWVLGLRYVFGTDVTSTEKKELAILIKAEVLPTLRERSMRKGIPTNVLDKIRKDFDKDLERLVPKRETEK